MKLASTGVSSCQIAGYGEKEGSGEGEISNEYKIFTVATDLASARDHESSELPSSTIYSFFPSPSASMLAGGESLLGGMAQTFISTGFARFASR